MIYHYLVIILLLIIIIANIIICLPQVLCALFFYTIDWLITKRLFTQFQNMYYVIIL